jgi:hypothetical protein
MKTGNGIKELKTEIAKPTYRKTAHLDRAK